MSRLISTAFAPVNIAWIKYMGKNGHLPANSSLSLTLSTLGTFTYMRTDGDGFEPGLSFDWHPEGYIPPPKGQEKVETFLRNEPMWKQLLTEFGFECHFPQEKILIHTRNNVPAGTGIATSASAFAALSLTWSAILAGPRQKEWMDQYLSGDAKMRRAMAMLSANGSGSSCRSFDGPWVEWNPEQGISVIDGGKIAWMDFIVLIEPGPKDIPSSDAHVRVQTSPHFKERPLRADRRLAELKSMIKKDAEMLPEIKKLVFEEAMDMHDLFHTSEPPFTFITKLTEDIMHSSQSQPFTCVTTIDAGANVHLFVSVEDAAACEQWIQKSYPHLKYLKDVTGYGAKYEEW